MRATCPDCGASGHVSAFMADDDGKRLAAALLELPAEVQRPALGYLSLFKPPKNALSSARALRIVQQLQQLVAARTVCRDERSNMARVATPAMWAEGIEQMLAQRGSLALPLPSHGYLRAVVFGLADQADARAERALEQQRQTGQHRKQEPRAAAEKTPRERYDNHVAWLRQRLSVGAITQDEFNREIALAKTKYGVAE